jgi:sulfatase maturation enzyme AslB (radical SAM superfamily)
LDDLWISLDGTRELNDLIRGVHGSFDKTIQGIRRLTMVKQEMKSPKPNLHVNFTISDLNCNHLVDFLKEMQNEGINHINFSHLNYVTEEMARRHNEKFGNVCQATPSSISKVNPQHIDIGALEKEIREVKKRSTEGGVGFTPDFADRTSLYNYYFKPDVPAGKNRCLVPWTVSSIQPNGDVILLTRCFNYVTGNVMKQDVLEIWRGEKYRLFRTELLKNKYFPACTRCCGML